MDGELLKICNQYSIHYITIRSVIRGNIPHSKPYCALEFVTDMKYWNTWKQFIGRRLITFMQLHKLYDDAQ